MENQDEFAVVEEALSDVVDETIKICLKEGILTDYFTKHMDEAKEAIFQEGLRRMVEEAEDCE